MKKMMVLLLAVSIFTVSLTTAGCFGSFSATKTVYEWNSKRGGKFANTIVMWVLMVVPVYSLAASADFIILNTIEFWTGKNPMALKAGETEEQKVTLNGKEYNLKAEQNIITVTPADGSSDPVSLRYDAAKSTWVIEKDGVSLPVAVQNSAEGKLTLIKANGSTVAVPLGE